MLFIYSKQHGGGGGGDEGIVHIYKSESIIIQQAYDNNREGGGWGFIPQVLAGPKYMQIGGLILKIERIADGIVQIPSPHMSPEATAPA